MAFDTDYLLPVICCLITSLLLLFFYPLGKKEVAHIKEELMEEKLMSDQDNKHYQHQMKLSLAELLFETPNFIAMTVSAIFSNSLIVWLDFINTLNNVVCELFLVGLSRKLKGNLKYEYNYGVSKLESIAALFCDSQLIIGLFIMLGYSVYQLFYPEKPSAVIGYVILVKLVNLGFDIYFVSSQRKIFKANKSAVIVAEYHAMIGDFAFDLAATISVFICWVFIDYKITWYFSPLFCIVLSVVFFLQTVKRLKSNIDILTEKTLPEEEQLKILKMLSKYYDIYDEFPVIKSKKEGETYRIDLIMSFYEDITYGQIKEVLKNISLDTEAIIPNARVDIVLANENLGEKSDINHI